MELYGNADSLTYVHTETCWGHFAESDESNVLFLDTCIGKVSPETVRDEKQLRHTGSTFLMIDLDADNDKDLILGDVDYPGLFALMNGGNPEIAYITEIDTLFPKESGKPIRIFSMPVAAYIDINNDNKKDLIVSTFDPSPFISKNLKNIHIYLNSGENNQPHFSFYTDSFLQENMIDLGSGAYPVFYDFDNDGLTDLFVGNYGYYQRSYYDQYYTLHTDNKSCIAYFKNTGTSQNPKFTFTDYDFGNFYLEDTSFLGLRPAFGDIDHDGIPEMIAGNSKGTLIFCKIENGDVIKNYDYANIDVGEYSSPQLFDLDKDGLLDLIIGKQDGKISYYHNDGTIENPEFSFITDFLGEVDVTDYAVSWYGYSTPYFFRLPDGETKLMVGSESGKINLYDNVDNNLDGKFNKQENIGEFLGLDNFNPDRGFRTSPALVNLDTDDYLELITGNFSGGLEFFGTNPDVLMSLKKPKQTANKLIISPNPAKSLVTISVSRKQSNFKVKIFTTAGKEISSKLIQHIKNNQFTLDVKNLRTGVYIITVQSGQTIYTGKLVIDR